MYFAGIYKLFLLVTVLNGKMSRKICQSRTKLFCFLKLSKKKNPKCLLCEITAILAPTIHFRTLT